MFACFWLATWRGGSAALTGDHLLGPLCWEKGKKDLGVPRYSSPALAELRNGLCSSLLPAAEWLALRRFSPMCSPAKRRRYDARVERRLTDPVSPSESAPDDQSASDGDTHSAHSPELSPLLTRAMTVDMDLLPLVDVDLPDLPQVRLCSSRRTDSSPLTPPSLTPTHGHPRTPTANSRSSRMRSPRIRRRSSVCRTSRCLSTVRL